MKPTLIHFKPLGDERGSLIAIEAGKIGAVCRSVGSTISLRRKKGVERGFHAHKALNQVAVAVTGSCEMVLDDGATAKLHGADGFGAEGGLD